MASRYHVRDFGALPGTVCGAEMQTAIHTAGQDIGSTLEWDAGVYDTDTQLVQPYHGLKMVGTGCGWPSNKPGSLFSFGNTVIRAVAPMGQLFRLEPPADPVGGTRLTGASIKGIRFDGNLMANFAFVAKSIVACELDWIVAARPLQYAMFIGVVADGCLPKSGVGGATYTEPRDSQRNKFGTILTDTRLNGAFGFYTHGDDIANVSLNDMDDIACFHSNGIGFYMDHGDGNTIKKATCYRQPGGTGVGGGFGAGTSVADFARHNVILYSQFGAGGFTAYSGPKPSLDNRIVKYSTDNGTPAPVIQPGATLVWN